MPNVADEPPDIPGSNGTEGGSPGGSIRLVCLGTALPLANLLDRVRGSAPPPGPLLGVPSVQWAAKHRPYVAGKREAHPQRLPVHFFSCSHRQTPELSEAGGPAHPNWQPTWPARIRSSDLVRRGAHWPPPNSPARMEPIRCISDSLSERLPSRAQITIEGQAYHESNGVRLDGGEP